MADETVELQMENDLKALFEGQSASAPAKGAESDANAQVSSDNKSGTVPPPTAPATTLGEEGKPADGKPADETKKEEELTEVEKTLKALEELKTEEEPKKDDKTPQLSDEQQIILQNIPNAETAQQLVQIANNHVAFEQAFEGGDFERVDKMFTHWNSQAYDAFMEHVYQKFVANGEWVERFVMEKEAEQNGTIYQHKNQSRLEREVQELKKQVAQREQNERSSQAQEAERRVFQNYTTEVDRLFTKVGITDPADQKYIRAAINADVVNDKKVVAEIRKGNMRGLTEVFKKNANEYLKRDQTFNQNTNAKLEAQNKKKTPVSGGAGNVTSDNRLPDDVKQVKKGEEDSWLLQSLGDFFGSRKKK